MEARQLKAAQAAPFFEVREVTKKFGGLTAVNRASFQVNQGEIFGLIGPNGAGKTTLFHLIDGYYRPTSGSVFFRGEEITGLKPNRICKKGIARTFQVVKPLARLSVLENVMVGAFNRVSLAAEAEERAWQAIELVGLTEQAHVPARSLTLSGRKRMEIARALATDPVFLLMDEAVAGLNPTEVDRMIEIIRTIRDRGVTILIVEHVMRVIMNISDRIAVLHHGRKIAEGSPQEIASDPKVIEAYLGEAGEEHA